MTADQCDAGLGGVPCHGPTLSQPRIAVLLLLLLYTTILTTSPRPSSSQHSRHFRNGCLFLASLYDLLSFVSLPAGLPRKSLYATQRHNE